MKVTSYRIKPNPKDNVVYTPMDRNSDAFTGWMKEVKRGAAPLFSMDRKLRDEIEKALLEEYEAGTIGDEARYAMIDYQLLLIRMKKKTIEEVPEILYNDVLDVIDRIDDNEKNESIKAAYIANGTVTNDQIVGIIDAYFSKFKDEHSTDVAAVYKTPHGFTKSILENK